MGGGIVLRNACDACHKLKAKCQSDGHGPCKNCRQKGQLCQFSPRSEMGRPRLDSPRGMRRRSTSKRSASSSPASQPAKRRKASTPGPATSLQYPVQQPSPPYSRNSPCPPQETMLPTTTEFYPECSTTMPVSMPTDASMYDAFWTAPALAHPDPLLLSTQPEMTVPGLWSAEVSGMLESTASMVSNASFGESLTSLADPPHLISQAGFSNPMSGYLDMSISDLSAISKGQDSQQQQQQQQRSIGLPAELTNAPASQSQNPEQMSPAYSQLTNILYSLRAARSRQEGPADRQFLEETFLLVSSLFDIVRTFGLDDINNHNSNNNESKPPSPSSSPRPSSSSSSLSSGEASASPCQLLVASVITMVVETYHQQAQGHGLLVPGAWTYDQAAAVLGTHHALQLYTDAVVMDLHLARLRAVLCRLGRLDPHTAQLLDRTRAAARAYARGGEDERLDESSSMPIFMGKGLDFGGDALIHKVDPMLLQHQPQPHHPQQVMVC